MTAHNVKMTSSMLDGSGKCGLIGQGRPKNQRDQGCLDRLDTTVGLIFPPDADGDNPDLADWATIWLTWVGMPAAA